MKKSILLPILFLCFLPSLNAQIYKDSKELKSKYIQLSGDLFKEVQLSGLFKDSKTFVDAIPITPPERIRRLFDSLKVLPDFSLNQFIYAYFRIPGEKPVTIRLPENQSMGDHIDSLWQYLIRTPDPENQYSTLLPLSYPYIVPGGRFI